MRRAPLLVAAILALVVSAVATGCGGDGDGGGDRLSKSEFIAKADSICGKFDSDQPKLPADLANVDPTAATVTDEQLDKFADYIEDVVSHVRDEVGELGDVNPPANLEKDWDSALATLEEATNELDEAGEAARDADREKFKAKLEESGKHSNEADTLAKRLGLSVCGS